MPAFFVWNIERKDEEHYWVYGVDEWDARDQIARSLRMDVVTTDAYGCVETRDFIPDLGVVVLADGSSTPIPDPSDAISLLDPDCRSRH
jgi:hypothetical protein